MERDYFARKFTQRNQAKKNKNKKEAKQIKSKKCEMAGKCENMTFLILTKHKYESSRESKKVCSEHG